jgi:hypothetical protein
MLQPIPFLNLLSRYVSLPPKNLEINKVRIIRMEYCVYTVYDMWPIGQMILQGGPHLSCTVHTGSDKDGPYVIFFLKKSPLNPGSDVDFSQSPFILLRSPTCGSTGVSTWASAQVAMPPWLVGEHIGHRAATVGLATVHPIRPEPPSGSFSPFFPPFPARGNLSGSGRWQR